jgi:hypothetical protein
MPPQSSNQEFSASISQDREFQFPEILAMKERRRYLRFPSGERAKILFPFSALNCAIRDVSARGACLEVDTAAAIADSFDLIPDHSDAHVCLVMWRVRNRIGVAFRL